MSKANWPGCTACPFCYAGPHKGTVRPVLSIVLILTLAFLLFVSTWALAEGRAGDSDIAAPTSSGKSNKAQSAESAAKKQLKLDQEFALAMKKAVEVWGKSEWNERIGQCIYDNATSITRGMKIGIIKHGFVNDAVYWKVSAADEASYQKVFDACQKEPSSNQIVKTVPDAGQDDHSRPAGGDLTLEQAFSEVIKKTAETVWGGGLSNERFSTCISARAAAITHDMKKAVVKHGLADDRVFYKVDLKDSESFEQVLKQCEKESEPGTGSESDLAGRKDGTKTPSSEAGSTAMSLEDAKKVTAKLAKTEYLPPPRSIKDVTEILDGKRAESLADIERLRVTADAVPPDTTDATELFDFYRLRADAAQLVGRSGQQIADLQVAIEHGRESFAAGRTKAEAFGRVLTGAASAQWQVGSMLKSKVLLDEAMSVAGRSEYPESEQLINLILLTQYHLFRDDLDKAERSLDTANESWAKEAKNRPYWPVESWDEMQSQFFSTEAKLLSASGKLEEAEVLHRKAIENFRRHKDVPNKETHLIPKLNLRVYLWYLAALGNNLVRQGRPVEAEINWREIIAESVRGFGRYSNVTADAATGLARALLEQGRFDDAETLAETTLEIWQTIQAPPSSVSLQQTRRLLTDIWILQEDWLGASRMFAQIEQGLADDPESRQRLLDQNPGYALTLMNSGQAEHARNVLTLAYETKRNSLGQKHQETAELGALYATVVQAAGEKEKALALYQATVPILLSRSRRSTGNLGAVYERRLALILEGYIGLLADLYLENTAQPAAGEYRSRAFQLADQARGRVVQAALDKSAARAAAKDPGAAELMRREQDAVHQIGALYGLLSDHMTQAADEQDPKVIQDLRVRIDQLRGARAALMEAIEAKLPEYAALVNPKAPDLETARSHLLDDEALLSVFVGRQRSFVWAIGRAGAPEFAAVAMGSGEIKQKVDQIRASLNPKAGTLGEIPPFDVMTAHELYARLLRPVEAAWRSRRHLVVVSHRALGYLPFAVFPTRPIAQPAARQPLFSEYRDVPWLVRDHSITVLPSVASLGTLRRMPPGAPDRRAFAGFADPVFSPDQVQVVSVTDDDIGKSSYASLGLRGLPVRLRGLGKAEKIEKQTSAGLSVLPPLPDTRREVNQIAQVLRADPGRDVFVGKAASEVQVKTMDLSDYKVVAFATHGLVPGDLDGLVQPALALSAPEVVGGDQDGLLTMGEVLGLRLDADWLVLSACNSGAGEGAGAEAISGLGRAFFYAGARSLLVSNWPVETTSARLLTTTLFRNQSASPGVGRAELLRRAMIEIIDGAGYKDPASGKTVFSYAHPIFWAPFTIVGNGSVD